MKAIVQNAYGSPAVLELREIDEPVVKDDGVLVRVHAAALHAGDYFVMRGAPYLVRFVAGWPKPKNYVPGFDLAGHVEAVGKKVTRFRPGDEVFAPCDRACAEYACAAEATVALKPTNLTFEQAAAVPISALAALHGLRDAGKVQPGQKVLINGASGGVGTFAVQIAKALGADVTGVCSTRNVEMVRSLGADHVIDYTREDFARSGKRYDLILDNVANRSFSECRRALTPSGVHIPNSGRAGMGYVIKALVRSAFVRQQGRPFLSTPNHEDLILLKGFVESAKMKPVIDRTYGLSETPEALGYVGEGHVRGKVVIAILKQEPPTETALFQSA
ncbi:MAG: NAD(P)-dependent alcohol dehydrogenase [Vicinamibacterales bacterium]